MSDLSNAKGAATRKAKSLGHQMSKAWDTWWQVHWQVHRRHCVQCGAMASVCHRTLKQFGEAIRTKCPEASDG
jgi:hypothetical protein